MIAAGATVGGDVRSSTGTCVLWGAALGIGVPLIAGALAATLIGLPLGVGILLMLATAFPVGYVMTSLIIGRKLMRRPGDVAG